MSLSYAATVAAQVVGLGEGLINMFGYIESEVVCRVSGNALSKKRDLYFLAAAIAFGKVSRLGPVASIVPPPGLVMMNDDATGRQVEITLQYRTSTAVALAMAAARAMTPLDLYNELPVLSGPKDETKGKPWNFTGPGFGFGGGVAAGPGGGGPVLGSALIPTLPWTDRVVLTTSDRIPDPNPAKPVSADLVPTPNPRPHGDYRSRGTLISLVYAALSNPGSPELMLYTAPESDTKYTGG